MLPFFNQGMNMIEKTISKLEEGLFKADRNTINITADTKDELQKKIELYQNKYDGYEPKFSSVKTDRNGRFIVSLSFNVNDKDNKETLAAKLGRGMTKVGKTIGAAFPKQGVLEAPNAFKLGQEKAKFVKEHPDVVYTNQKRKPDGTWSVEYAIKRYDDTQKNTNSQDRINNIQKTLKKLSDDQLKKIEDIIK